MPSNDELTPAQRRRRLDWIVIPYLAGLIVLGCRPDLAAWSASLDTFAEWAGGLLCALSAGALALQMAIDAKRKRDDDGMGGLFQTSQSVMCGMMYWRIGTYLVEHAPDWAAHLIAAAVLLLLAIYLRARRKAGRIRLPEARVVEESDARVIK